MRSRVAHFRFLLIIASLLSWSNVPPVFGQEEADPDDPGTPPPASENPNNVETNENGHEAESSEGTSGEDGDEDEAADNTKPSATTKPKVIERYDLRKANATLSSILTVLTHLINVYNSADVFEPIASNQLYNHQMLTQAAVKNLFNLGKQKCAQLGGYLFAPTDYLDVITDIQKAHGLKPDTDFFWVNVDQDPRTAEIYYPVTRGLFPKRWKSSQTQPAVYVFNESHCYVLNTAPNTADNARLQQHACEEQAPVLCQFDYESQKERLKTLQTAVLEDMKVQKASLEDFQEYLGTIEPDDGCSLPVGAGVELDAMFHLEKPMKTLKEEATAEGINKAGKIVHIIDLFLEDLRSLHEFKLRLKRSTVSVSNNEHFLCVHEPVAAIAKDNVGKSILNQLERLYLGDSSPFPQWIGTMVLIGIAFTTLLLAFLTFSIPLLCADQCNPDRRCPECRRPLKSSLKQAKSYVTFEEDSKSKKQKKKGDKDKEGKEEKKKSGLIRAIQTLFPPVTPEPEMDEEMSIVTSGLPTKRIVWQVSPTDQVKLECAENEVQPLLAQIMRVSSGQPRKRKGDQRQEGSTYPELNTLLSVIDNPTPSAPTDLELPPYKYRHSDSDSSHGSIHPFSGIETLNKTKRT